MNTMRLTNDQLQVAICSTHSMLSMLSQNLDDSQGRILLRVHLDRLLDEQRQRAIGLAKKEPDA